MINYDENTLVVADLSRLTIYSYSESYSEAEFILEKAKVSVKKNIEMYLSYSLIYDTADRKYWKNRVDEAVNVNYQVMKMNEFFEKEREMLLSKPLHEITEEEYLDAFECLPPFRWCTILGVEMFCCSEMWSGNYTAQYAKCGGKFYSKMVDYKDKSTWIYNFMQD